MYLLQGFASALHSAPPSCVMSKEERVDELSLSRFTTWVGPDATARRTVRSLRAPTWGTLLRSCGSYESYLRTYRGPVRDHLAAEFLMVDRLSPRSVFYALSMGLVGGLLPAIRAARLPIPSALREL